jgi:CRP/FNR family transcriptional regulator
VCLLLRTHCSEEFKSGRGNVYSPQEEVKHLIAVRSGCFTVVDEDKTLFAVYTPGQLIGGENLYRSHYHTTAIAVQDAEVCMIDYSAMYGLSQLTLGTFSHTIKLLSETADDNLKMIKVLLQHDAFKKVAMFILLMSERNKAKSFTATPFPFLSSKRDCQSVGHNHFNFTSFYCKTGSGKMYCP